MADWNKPLTLRQVVSLLALLATVALLIIMARNAIHHQSDAVNRARCIENAPAYWDCQNHPTDYPRQP